MNYNTEMEPTYKDLNQVAEQQREYETLVLDFSRGTKDISLEKVGEILSHLRIRNRSEQ